MIFLKGLWELLDADAENTRVPDAGHSMQTAPTLFE